MYYVLTPPGILHLGSAVSDNLKNATEKNIEGTTLEEQDKLFFSVDSALLRELGERLVGKAHIALAELIKNSYDADALTCCINIQPNRIEIVDNGHGMTFEEFKDFWMRVGTTHKQLEGVSRFLHRPLTGSKGVGRLAVQFLAHHVKIETTARGSDTTLKVEVDWDKAVERELLTQAEASYEMKQGHGSYADNSPQGFRVILEGLFQNWNADSLKSLAQEIWTLRPPFSGFAGKSKQDEAKDFNIELIAPDVASQKAFDKQAEAATSQWIAKVEGRIERGWKSHKQLVTLTFRDGDEYVETFPIEDCHLNNVSWEIRIFKLSGHMGSNIKVGDAREYFADFGGVHVYDGPFRLPYYGIQQDWLGIELDHSHRRVRSKLLPSHFHVERALNDLPTQGRILGVVRVNTGAEMANAPSDMRRKGEYLKIQVTRDRLQINSAYEQLKDAVRRSLDFYAVTSMRRRIDESKRERPELSPIAAANTIQDVLSTYQASIPAEVYSDLQKEITIFVDTARREQNYRDTLAALLGPLATAGMTALALEHETKRQLSLLEGIASQVEALTNDMGASLSAEIKEWIMRFRKTRQLFEPLTNNEDRETVAALRAERVVGLVSNSMALFLDGIELQQKIPNDLYLPFATLAEWQALFQNVLTNSINAMIDSERRTLMITGGSIPGRKAWIRVSDTGVGIDLDKAEGFFEPFRREGTISEERKSMGLGGHGLGLTIVQMIAEGHNCNVSFIPPEDGFTTTFELSWKSQDARET